MTARTYDSLSPADLDVIERRLHSERRYSNAYDDAIRLLAEVRRLRLALALTRAEYANLLAAARATIAAVRDGETDPLGYLRDELDAHGQLPAPDLHPAQLLALTGLLGTPAAEPADEQPVPWRLTGKGWRAAGRHPRPGRLTLEEEHRR